MSKLRTVIEIGLYLYVLVRVYQDTGSMMLCWMFLFMFFEICISRHKIQLINTLQINTLKLFQKLVGMIKQ